jgi:hypothetical protein
VGSSPISKGRDTREAENTGRNLATIAPRALADVRFQGI